MSAAADNSGSHGSSGLGGSSNLGGSPNPRGSHNLGGSSNPGGSQRDGAALPSPQKLGAGPGPVAPSRHVKELGVFGALATRIGARVTGKKNLGVFATIGRAPRVFKTWLAYSASMMPFGYLSRQDTELIILRVAALRGADYELDHHRELAQRTGVTLAEVDAVTNVSHDSAPHPSHGFTRARGVLLDAATELVETRHLTDSTWARLRTHVTPRQQVALVMLVTNYDGLATALHVLGVPVDEQR